MNTIKNIHKISEIVGKDQIEKLEAGAKLHLRHSNISFKILDVDYRGDIFKKIQIRTEQGRAPSENYADVRRLIDLTRELFKNVFPDPIVIDVHPVPYTPAIVDVVDPAWIADKMLNKGIRIKDIQVDTGIDKTNLSAWIKGLRPMSQPVKAMFYFYLYRS